MFWTFCQEKEIKKIHKNYTPLFSPISSGLFVDFTAFEV